MNVTGLNESNATPAMQPRLGREQIRASVESVLNALASSTGRDANLDKAKVNEEQLYAAMLHANLTESHPQLAHKLLGELPKLFRKFRTAAEPKPILRSVNHTLQNMIQHGELSRQQVKNLKCMALGTAQIDGNRNRLGSRQIEFVDKGEVSPQITYMDRVLDKIAVSPQASKEEMRKITDSISRARERGISYAPKNKPSKKVTYHGASPETAKPQVVSEKDVPLEAPSGSKVRFHQMQFGYKPSSEKDGNALIQLPSQYADKVETVEIQAPDGELLSFGKPQWQEDDGRRYVRFGVPGDTFGESIKVKIIFVDGSSLFERIDHAADVYARFQ